MKLSEGFTKTDATISTVALFILSFFCASLAFKKIDLGLAYALWSGLGTVGIIAAGILFFDEPSNLMKIGFTALIVIGVIGLNFTS
jgi:multidrug transporter EmrE-like cation transporter